MTSTTSGWTRSPGVVPAESARVAAGGGALEQRGAHLRAAGVVQADEQRGGHQAASRVRRMPPRRAGRRARRGRRPRSGRRGRSRSRVQAPDGERRAERAGRVHRGAGDGAAEQRVEPDGAADRDRGGGADGARVGGDGDDHEHQERASGRSRRRARCRSPTLGTVAPRCAGCVGPGGEQDAAPASVAPASCAATYASASRGGKCRVSVNAIVTAGLMCAPERCPVGVDHRHDRPARTRGLTPTAPEPCVSRGVGDDGAAPANTRANAAIASAPRAAAGVDGRVHAANRIH